MIYLDNSATTEPYPEVIHTFVTANERYFGNPSSLHQKGSEAENLLREARRTIARLLNAQPSEVVFTSGGSESNNLAIQGIARAREKRGRHLITTAVEHPSVLETCEYLETVGFSVTYLPVNEEGVVSLTDLKQAITEETILVSVMHVNHETGAIQPVLEFGEYLKKFEKIRFHVDNVQGFGKVNLDIQSVGIDLCSVSGHKFHGLKGTGFLYVRSGVNIQPLVFGGGQEFQLRAGTENVPAIASLAKAARMAMEKKEIQNSKLARMKQELFEWFDAQEGVHVNTPRETSAPHIMNVSIERTMPEVLIQALSNKDIHVSSKSACASKQPSKSAVLLAQFGEEDERAATGLRVSMSWQTSQADLEALKAALSQIVPQVREMKEVKS
ncbi:cysteine desulfurase family protein [Geomicrobium sp. JCM 19039]|uniref:cysteine desulfurase family protein n=1 Tax=Geomicrobium sp. JCM 19039 TaxID=1460636 RepID=UPI00045F36D4|nr:cysteine desulfurase family protein [Geomicrobium sp. JCM 19039]GAK12941.1 cysteine desulfurase [Geomicrobium sp. JCM 19039]